VALFTFVQARGRIPLESVCSFWMDHRRGFSLQAWAIRLKQRLIAPGQMRQGPAADAALVFARGPKNAFTVSNVRRLALKGELQGHLDLAGTADGFVADADAAKGGGGIGGTRGQTGW
jgi:hypothetical protein